MSSLSDMEWEALLSMGEKAGIDFLGMKAFRMNLEADPEVLEEFCEYLKTGDFPCKVKAGEVTLPDIMIYQIDHFRAYLDRDTENTKYNRDYMVLHAFDTLMRMRKGVKNDMDAMEYVTGTDQII